MFQRWIGIKELDADALYQVSVWANNQLGKGEVSTVEFQTTPDGEVHFDSFYPLSRLDN